MPPAPVNFFIKPLYSSVVALPRTFGPTTLKMVEPTANSATSSTAYL